MKGFVVNVCKKLCLNLQSAFIAVTRPSDLNGPSHFDYLQAEV